MPREQKEASASALCLLVLQALVSFIVFDLQTIQGHVYVIAIEAIIQYVIYVSVISNVGGKPLISGRKASTVIFLANLIALTYKLLFASSLVAAQYITDFTRIIPFALGPLYSLSPVADGQSDAIANALYQCGICLSKSEIPLNEPGIAYAFIGISYLAGEFNQHILWLTLHAFNFVTATILLKITAEFFPTIRFPLMVPALYILLPEIQGASLTLFKDGLIAFSLVSLFYLNLRRATSKTGASAFTATSVVLLIFLYSLRSGMLAAIVCLTVLNCILDYKSWRQHVLILVATLLLISISANIFGFSNPPQIAVTRTTDNATNKAAKNLDVENLTYTTTKEGSIFHKLKLHEVSASNFFYAPFVKGALYFLLPLPVNGYVNTMDLFHKISTLIYATLFTLLLIGLYTIAENGIREERYLLLVSAMLVAMLLGAGPLLLPRYRIMVAAFFLLIAAIGCSRISRHALVVNIGCSAGVVAGLVIWYDALYSALQSII